MENTPWRILFVCAGASLFLLLISYFIVLPKQAKNMDKVEKISKLKDVFVSGYKEGKKSWEFYAKEGWVVKNQAVTYLDNVTKGTLYQSGEVIARNLSAPEVKVFKRSKIVEASGNDANKVSAYIIFASKEKETKKRKFAYLVTDFLKYIPNQEKTDLKGNIIIKDKKNKIWGNQMTIDHKQEVSTFLGEIKIARDDITLTCDQLIYDSKNESLIPFGNIKSKIKGKQKTLIKASKMNLFTDETKDITMQNNIEIVQGRKSIVANDGVYNKSKGIIFLSNNVKAVIEKGGAILKKETLKKLKNPDAKELLKEKTFIQSDKLDISTKTENFQASGNVFVFQKKREAKSDFADYSDSSEIIKLTGNVYMKKNDDWIKCDKVNVWVKDEIFEAVGSVEAEFKIKL